MKIVIDSANPRGHSIWNNDQCLLGLIRELNESADFDAVVLDRGNISLPDEIEKLPFPTYSPDRFNAYDSILVQKICNYLGVEFFVSGASTPLTLPMLLVLVENQRRDYLSYRAKMEIDLAAACSDLIICATSEDEYNCGPHYPSARSKVILGVDKFKAVAVEYDT